MGNPPDKYCILVTDDDYIARLVATRALSSHGYLVLQASDGAEALRLEAEYGGRIHVLVTDINMPGVDGHKLARELKRRRPDLKVLIVSAEAESGFPAEARSHDFALLKPVATETLVSNVERLLREHADLPAR